MNASGWAISMSGPRMARSCFRHALSLAGGDTVSPAQAAALIVAAREAGERLYPAFHYLVWGGKSVEEAVAAAMFDTAGEA